MFETVFVSFFSATVVQFIGALFFNLPQAPLLRYEATLPKRQQIGGDKTGVQLVQQKDGVVAARLRQLSVAGLRVRGTWGGDPSTKSRRRGQKCLTGNAAGGELHRK